jgi:hypothetical protein
MKQALLVFAVVGVLAGCAAPVPFEPAAPLVLGRVDPVALVEGQRESLPDHFHLLSSIVFEYNWLTVAGIGYLELDRVDENYKVSCMNHLGVKLFEFAGDRTGLTSQYAIEPLARQGNIAATVGEDIKRIYLDLVPADDARFILRKKSATFRQRSGDGALEYEFSGVGMHLTAKTYREDHRAVWRASYYEYRQKSGKFYPMGIVFTNYRFGYRLIVRQKEILD